jgi:hypothetical protein
MEASGKVEALESIASVVGTALELLEGSSESPVAGLAAETSTGSTVGWVAVAVSVGAVGADAASTELVVELEVAESAGAVVDAAVSVGLTVGAAVVSGLGAAEVSVTGAAASVVAGDSVVLDVVVGTVAVAVSAAASRGSLMVPPFQSIAIRFASLVTYFLPLKSAGVTRVGAPGLAGEMP